MNQALGIDIGGTGIKVARVNTAAGTLSSERKTAATPSPATPGAVVAAVAELVGEWKGPVGVGFPGVVRRGVVGTAANLDSSWIGYDAQAAFAERFRGAAVEIVNDADAAGLAEMRFGAGVGRGGVVAMVTLGTGIGTAFFNDGVLLPNTEFGHLIVGGVEAEEVASGRVKDEKPMSWEEWSGHLTEFLGEIERLFNPDLIIIGGGISSAFATFRHLVRTSTEVVPAKLANDAGIVGAALNAVERAN